MQWPTPLATTQLSLASQCHWLWQLTVCGRSAELPVICLLHPAVYSCNSCNATLLQLFAGHTIRLTSMTPLQSRFAALCSVITKQQDIQVGCRIQATTEHHTDATAACCRQLASAGTALAATTVRDTSHTCSAILPVPEALEIEHELGACLGRKPIGHMLCIVLLHCTTQLLIQQLVFLPALTHSQCTPHSVAANVARAQREKAAAVLS